MYPERNQKSQRPNRELAEKSPAAIDRSIAGSLADQAYCWAAKSQLTRFQNASTYLGRRLR